MRKWLSILYIAFLLHFVLIGNYFYVFYIIQNFVRCEMLCVCFVFGT